jgi:hypothetical protein
MIGGVYSKHGRDETYMQLLKILVEKPEKGSLGRPRLRRDDNIKLDLEDAGFWDTDRIHTAQDRVQFQALVNTVMNRRFP